MTTFGKHVSCGVLLLSGAMFAAVSAQGDSPKAPASKHVGKRIPKFQALGIDDTTFRSSSLKEEVLVVAFMGVECPLANLYLPRLNELREQFSEKSVAFLTINSNEQDTIQVVREQTRRLKVKFPVLKDAGNRVADQFAASRTPEVFVLDKDRKVRYHGMIDDQYGYLHRRLAPTKTYVADAINAILAGKPVLMTETAIDGCHIGRRRTPRKKTSLSFYRDVLPILQNRCQVCHRKGEIGPFTLADYDKVAIWAETIKETVQERRMPPWSADPRHGEFSNDLSLSQGEIDTLIKWVDHGCPEGDPADKPAPRHWTAGWQIGKPDRVLSMPEPFKVPATGVVPYKFFVISEEFEEDQWVQAVECRPGNRAVVHHMLALIYYPRDRRRSQNGLRRGFFAAAVPGNTHITFPPGHAKRIPAGTRLVVQMHYTPNGSDALDQSKVGIVFAKGRPKFEVRTIGIANRRIFIPKGEADHPETKSYVAQRDMTITALMPHMHLRGKSFKYVAQLPDGTQRTLLSVPRWDFNWQHRYLLKKPVVLPKGTTLKLFAHWDNSEENPSNILPLVDVGWGDQTYDEMMIGYVDDIVALDKEEPDSP